MDRRHDVDPGAPKARTLRARARTGEALYGITVTIPEPRALQIVSRARFDFCVIDMQHAPIDIRTVDEMLAQLSLHPVLVRPPTNDPTVLGQLADLGVNGVIVPLVNSDREAESAVKAGAYPPLGIRSWGPRPVDLAGGVAEFLARHTDEWITLVQIETRQAVDNLDTILEIPGLDGVVIGPSDLALSLGLPFGGEALMRAARDVLRECDVRGLVPGSFAGGIDQVSRWTAIGSRLTVVASDLGLLTQALTTASHAVMSREGLDETTA